MLLVALVGTLRIALSQPDQTATTKTRSRRAPDPAGAADVTHVAAAVAAPEIEVTPVPDAPGSVEGGAQATDEVPDAATAPSSSAAPTPDRRSGRRRPASMPGLIGVAPAGFQWMEAGPAPRARAGFALVVILAVLGALLAVAVAGLVVGAAVAVQGAVG